MADTNDSKGQTIGTAAAVGAALPVLDSIVNGLFQSNINKKKMEFDKEEARKQRVFSEQMWQKQADWDLDMWNKSNEYNTASEQVKRLREAGLNPLYYGVDGVAAQPMSAPQAMGYDRASAANITNPYNGGLMNVMSAMKDVQLKDAQIDKLKEDTTGIQLDNEFKDKTMKARVEAEEFKKDIDRKTAEKIDKEKNKIETEIGKIIAETENEKEKKFYIQAQTNVANMQANEIAALLPYKQLLMDAQTLAQKAAAAASFAKAAIDNKLLSEGAIDAMIDEYKASAKSAEARAVVDAFVTAVRTGNVFDPEDFTGTRKEVAPFINHVFEALGMLGTAFVGPLSGLLKG